VRVTNQRCTRSHLRAVWRRQSARGRSAAGAEGLAAPRTLREAWVAAQRIIVVNRLELCAGVSRDCEGDL
jgi:hypothetical protein